MLRLALLPALAFSLTALAQDEDDTPTPAPSFAAEAVQVKVDVKPGDGFDYAELTFKVTKCIAGPCFTHQLVKVLTPLGTWRGKHGRTMGLVKYEWKDKKGAGRTWALAMRLDDADEHDRFLRDSDEAVATVGESTGSAVATRD